MLFLTDQGIEMLEKLMGRMLNRGEKKHKEHLQKDGKAINEKVRLYAKVGKALIEAKELEQDPFVSLQSIISWEQLIPLSFYSSLSTFYFLFYFFSDLRSPFLKLLFC